MAVPALIYLGFCVVVGFLGRRRRIGMLGFFLASIVVTPLLVLLILVLTAPKRYADVEYRRSRSGRRRGDRRRAARPVVVEVDASPTNPPRAT
jgi:hypothetical protein